MTHSEQHGRHGRCSRRLKGFALGVKSGTWRAHDLGGGIDCSGHPKRLNDCSGNPKRLDPPRLEGGRHAVASPEAAPVAASNGYPLPMSHSSLATATDDRREPHRPRPTAACRPWRVLAAGPDPIASLASLRQGGCGVSGPLIRPSSGSGSCGAAPVRRAVGFVAPIRDRRRADDVVAAHRRLNAPFPEPRGRA
jgi:hypothetical protein